MRKLFRLVAFLMITLMPAAIPFSSVAQPSQSGDKNLNGTIYLVLMRGTPSVHILKMQDMKRCLKAAEHTPSAECLNFAKAKDLGVLNAPPTTDSLNNTYRND
jgi:hypothetical protein